MISKEDPSSFNQAIMDLGATICTPKKAFVHVLSCDGALSSICGRSTRKPSSKKKKAKKQQKKKYIALLIQNKEGKYIIEKRPDSGLLAGLWQFPMIPADEIVESDWHRWLLENYEVDAEIKTSCTAIKHVFSHIIWNVDVRRAVTNQETVSDSRLKFVSIEELKEYPFPVPHQKNDSFFRRKMK